jgi:hypothetical protein
MVLEVVETHAHFAQQVILEPPLALRPLEMQKFLLVFGFYPVFPSQQNFSHNFVVIAPSEKEVTSA